jgi:hypothetical protein
MAVAGDDVILKYLELDQAILKAVNKILGGKGTQLEIMQFILSPAFDEMIYDLGLTETLKAYDVSLLKSSASQVKTLNKVIKVAEKQITISTTEEVLRQAKRFSAKGMNDASIKIFQDTLTNQIASGVARKDILLQMESIPLTTTQLQTNVHTAYSSINRSITAVAFEDQPEQKFFYEGGTIPTSSPQCEWLVNNQNPGGYTKAEIDAGISTPDGAISWQGRIPNFNCIHEWLPIELE